MHSRVGKQGGGTSGNSSGNCSCAMAAVRLGLGLASWRPKSFNSRQAAGAPHDAIVYWRASDLQFRFWILNSELLLKLPKVSFNVNDNDMARQWLKSTASNENLKMQQLRKQLVKILNRNHPVRPLGQWIAAAMISQLNGILEFGQRQS